MPEKFELFRPSTWGVLAKQGRTVGAVVERVSKIVPSFVRGKSLKQEFDVKAYANDGYRKNAVVNACIAEILSTVAEPTLEVLDVQPDGTEKPVPLDHPLYKILRTPNPETSQKELIERIVLHAQVAGQFYIHKARDKSGALGELWPLRPDRVQPIIDSGLDANSKGLVGMYEYTIEGVIKKPIPTTDIVSCIVQPDYLNDYAGLPPMSAVAMWIDMDNEAGLFLRAFFENNAEPSGYLKFKKVTNSNDRKRAREIWAERHGRGIGMVTNWHKTAVIDDDVEYMKTGATPNQLRLDAIFDETEARICSAFGVSPILVAMRIGLQQASYNNVREARTSLWEEKLLPLYAKIGDKLTTHLAVPEFGDSLVIRFNVSKVKALQPDRERKQNVALMAWDARLINRNATLRELDYPECEDKEFGAEYAPDPTAAGSLGPLATPPKATGTFRSLIARDVFDLKSRREDHATAQASLKKLLAKHFKDQGAALATFVEDEIAKLEDK